MATSESTTEVIVGGVVLAAAIGFLVYAGQATGFSTGGDSYELTASFRSVDGVTVGTDVRLAGVKIGSVRKLDLNRETYLADARLGIRKDILIPTDSAAVISSEGLLGDNFVEIIPGGAMENIEPGGEILDTQGAVSLLHLLLKYVGGSDKQSSQ
ncbi:MAG: outer membrane lipid asymmetry maintenance protein MlaD [Alphaproteobacteria bacterium]|nr:MAG: outer membrane lipid asymmetry maintenance protein MlaD [Alphaproteobacteria bacterium]